MVVVSNTFPDAGIVETLLLLDLIETFEQVGWKIAEISAPRP